MSIALPQSQVNLIPLASYTQNNPSPVQVNNIGHGVKVYTYIQANPGALGSITVQILGVDLGSGQTFLLLASAALTAVGLTVLTIFPGLVAVANQTLNDVLPLSWQVNVVANNANPMTYQVDCDVIS